MSHSRIRSSLRFRGKAPDSIRLQGISEENEDLESNDWSDGGSPLSTERTFDFASNVVKGMAAPAPSSSKRRATVHMSKAKTGFQFPTYAALLAAVMIVFTLLTVPTLAGANHGVGGSGGGRVLLQDVQTLTLYNGKMTAGRRSAPVPQSACTGGTAAGQYTPPTIQCTNKGWDGVDAQWECKADLDNAYRFGETTVVCEGFDYPDDPYILAGSCGVEYTLELTQEGRDMQQAKASGYSGNSRYNSGGHGYSSYGSNSNRYGSSGSTFDASSMFSSMFMWIMVIVLIGAFCGDGRRSGNSSNYGYNTGYSSHRSSGPGFFTGYALGSYANSPRYSSPGRAWGGSSGGGGYGRSSSSGTRSASGFGGTRRR